MTTYHIQQLHVPSSASSSSASASAAHNSSSLAANPSSPLSGEEFECEFCDYKTFRKSNMTQHIKTVHDRVKDFACDRCEYRSARRSNVNYHIKTVHENIKDYSCQFCNFKSARKYNVIQHSDRVHKHEPQTDMKFIHHKVPVPELPAAARPQATTRRPRKRAQQQRQQQHHPIAVHQQHPTHHFTLDPPTMVNPNHMNYASMTLNYAHHQTMYNSPPTINNPGNVQQQQQLHLPNNPVGGMNNFGGGTSTMNFSSLQPIHYNQLNQPPFNGSPANAASAAKGRASKAKEYACTFCPYKTSKKKNLSIHLQAIHQANPIPNYSNVHNVNPAAVLSVKMQVGSPTGGGHNSQNSPGKAKNFNCSFCDFRTAYRRNLNAHINEVHLKERREHKCHICDFKSTRKSNLAQHLKSVHERVKDHHCWLCGFTSTRKRNVEKHVLSMHLQKDQQLTGGGAAGQVKVKMQPAE